MNDEPTGKTVKHAQTFAKQVGTKAQRKLKAQRDATPGVWFGLGMMGLVGWSVDDRHPGPRSWTLALLLAGLCIGCLNAWHWVSKEDKAMQDEQEDDDE